SPKSEEKHLISREIRCFLVETTELERHLTNDAVVPQALFDDVPSHRKSPSGLVLQGFESI
ncbi:MAG: hypothetical protein K1W21_04015, partial [Oscillospiraceae bacterium]